jgi:nickel-dependent lactate racemase
MKITFPYSEIPPVDIPDSFPIKVLKPKQTVSQSQNEIEIIKQSLNNPIGQNALKTLAIQKKNILIVVDDYSRNTPVHLILPEILKEIYSAGIPKQNIRVLIASGTHRNMTEVEKAKKLGRKIQTDLIVLDHSCDQIQELVHLPTTPGGTEIWVNRAVLEADLVIGIGHIVPHRVAGFSGGGKIIQPGVCGTITTGQTHWLSAHFTGAEIIGKINNPVRDEIDTVAISAGLKFIVNVVLDGEGRIVSCHSGDPIQAFREGAQKSREIFGVPISALADIVIADSFPTDNDLWLAAKGIYAGDLALKQNGILILVTPCPEGVSAEHPLIEKIGYQPFAKIEASVAHGDLQDLTLAAHLVHVGRVIKEKGKGILVSPGITRETTLRMGFQWAATPQDAFDLAIKQTGENASIAILKNGGEIMPIIEGIHGKF